MRLCMENDILRAQKKKKKYSIITHFNNIIICIDILS